MSKQTLELQFVMSMRRIGLFRRDMVPAPLRKVSPLVANSFTNVWLRHGSKIDNERRCESDHSPPGI